MAASLLEPLTQELSLVEAVRQSNGGLQSYLSCAPLHQRRFLKPATGELATYWVVQHPRGWLSISRTGPARLDTEPPSIMRQEVPIESSCTLELVEQLRVGTGQSVADATGTAIAALTAHFERACSACAGVEVAEQGGPEMDSSQLRALYLLMSRSLCPLRDYDTPSAQRSVVRSLLQDELEAQLAVSPGATWLREQLVRGAIFQNAFQAEAGECSLLAYLLFKASGSFQDGMREALSFIHEKVADSLQRHKRISEQTAWSILEMLPEDDRVWLHSTLNARLQSPRYPFDTPWCACSQTMGCFTTCRLFKHG